MREGCSATPLPKLAGSTFEGGARYCAEHADFECSLCGQTFQKSDVDFERKCECGGAIKTRRPSEPMRPGRPEIRSRIMIHQVSASAAIASCSISRRFLSTSGG